MNCGIHVAATFEAWTARDPAALAELVGPELMVGRNRCRDDFDRKGWHKITERLSEPQTEYLDLVNRRRGRGLGHPPRRDRPARLHRRLER